MTKTKTKADPNAPAKALSSFNLYVRHRTNESEQIAALPFADKGRTLGVEWSTLDDSSRLPFIKAAEEDRCRYKNEMDSYKKTDHYNKWLLMQKSSNETSDRPKCTSRQKKQNQPNNKQLPETVDNSLKLPIFTSEFLEFNRLRENKLRTLKREAAQLEEETALLSKHVDKLKHAQTELKARTEIAKSIEVQEADIVQNLRRDLFGIFSKVLSSTECESLLTHESISNETVSSCFSHLRELTACGDSNILKKTELMLKDSIVLKSKLFKFE